MIPLKMSPGDAVLLVCDQRYRHARQGLLHKPLIAVFRGETYPAEVHPRIMDGLRSQGAQYDAVRLIEFEVRRPRCRNRIHRVFFRLRRDGSLRDRQGHHIWIERAGSGGAL